VIPFKTVLILILLVIMIITIISEYCYSIHTQDKTCKSKFKVKVVGVLIHLSLTSGLDWGKLSVLHPGWFTLGERAPVPIRQKVGRTVGLVWTFWRREESLASTGNQTTFPPSYSLPSCRYSDYVISAPTILHMQNKNNTLIMNFDIPAIT